ncbi:MAG: tripartite tricarboxylate transporter TctB family protein [Alphaproteobacteria bacterium]|nr:tripartite tricarboxylate transporter TctB family protein [Alphaproteobacteria bacterium]
MKAARLVTALLVLALGVYLAWQGTRLRIEGDFGPGPGFFPFWIGSGIAVLATAWLAQLVLRPAVAAGERFLPPRDAAAKLAIVVGALVAFMLLLRPIGFNLAMLGLLLVLFFAVDRRHAAAKVAIAVAASFGVHWLFEHALNVPLPDAALPALQALGL